MIAHSPSATRVVQCFRNSIRVCTFSSLQQPPSMRPMSQCFVNVLMSLIGDLLNSTSSTRSRMRSSMSRIDMWHPKQPARDAVAMIFFCGIALSPYGEMSDPIGIRSNLLRPIGTSNPFPLRRIAPTGHISHRLLHELVARVARGLGIDVDDQPVAALAEGEERLALRGVDAADAPLAEDAAVVVLEDLRMPRLHAALGKGVRKPRSRHAVAVSQGLQLAAAALFAGRAEVVALREKDLHDRGAEILQLGRDRLDFHVSEHPRRARRGEPPVDPHRADPAGAFRRDPGVVAQGGDVDAVFHRGRDKQRARRGLAPFPIYRESHNLRHDRLLTSPPPRRSLSRPPRGRTRG